MSSPTHVLKSVGPKLIPFFNAIVVYYVLLIPFENPSLWSMIIRILPMLGLILFVFLYGVGLAEEYTFTRRILIGLIFSTIGDAFMGWPEFFLIGMILFGIAHVWYIKAFGLKDLNTKTGIALFMISSFLISKILPGTTGVFTTGVVIYAIFIATMMWAATSRVLSSGENWTWTELIACIGSFIFAISDTFIAFDKFVFHNSNSQIIIMTTYYLAQFLIALSVVGSSSTYKLAQKKLLEQSESEIIGKSADLNMVNQITKYKTKACS